jgi:uncharacterized protein YcfJ
MRLYVINHKGDRIYLNIIAHSRKELAEKVRSRRIVVQGQVYDVNHVKAEDESDNTASGAIVGGLIGVLGGPIGILLGALGGGVIGNNMATSETEQVEYFNNTKY